ncbi:acyl-CoA dehydrogenase family protein [Sphingomonas nostoxanthinifaciens]|uniref:acyl-CoA dehydrogenase family protein n=1 Tax=Sphingomonas nostoxanthinifaciens TaxID=2872652 RepID=UPI001CC20A44|nr:acyl-CoA dehydrogenase family protein [Sphingomonas nostoxanthinifaciens]UAK25705.1 acyl-CoA/acyl-ACP dehydrogenase [Sphingomonas nostoxanthinifaciens]
MTSAAHSIPVQPDDVAERLAALGARYDAAPNFPIDSLRVLYDAGYHRRFAPVACGGDAFASPQLFCADMARTLRFVGRGDLSIGRLYEGHVNALQLFDWYARPEQRIWLAHALDAGAWFGVWATEPQPGVRIEGQDPIHLTGEKIFASGAGGLDYALATAALEGSERQLVITPANDRARSDVSAWRVRGMRATVSGRYSLDDIAIDPAMLLGAPGDYDRDPRFTAGAWRFCAVQLGGIEALLIEVRRSMRDVARGDPMQRARFAEAVVATRSAGLWVDEAARRFAHGDADAVAIARLTRGIVEQAGFTVMEAAARLLGTRSAFDGERADKIIRDLSLYLRQAGPDHARDEAAKALLDHDVWNPDDRLW